MLVVLSTEMQTYLLDEESGLGSSLGAGGGGGGGSTTGASSTTGGAGSGSVCCD